MSSSTASSNLRDLPKDVIDSAELLGGILVAKVNDIVREAISLEVNMWRTDVLQILKELRKDIHCRFGDSDVERGDDPSIAHTHLGVYVSLVLANNSCDSSCAPVPLKSFRKLASSEQRLASKFFVGCPNDSKSQIGREMSVLGGDSSFGQASASSHDRAHFHTFDSVIPREGANIIGLPSEVTVQDSERAPTSRSYELVHSVQDRWVVGTSSILSTQSSTAAPMDCVGGLLPAREPISSEDSPDVQVSDRGDSESDMWFSSLRSVTNTVDAITMTERWQVEARKFYEQKSISAREASGLSGSASSIMFRLLGVFPWSVQLVIFSSMYWFAFLCCLLASTISVIMTSFFGYRPQLRDNLFASHVDDIVAVGALFSFLAALWKGSALQGASWLLESYLSRAGRLQEASRKSRLEIAVMLLIWSLCVVLRFYSNASALNIRDFAVAFNIFVLLAISFHALRLCHCLCYMVDDFCGCMRENSDSERAVREFFLLHCTIRTACASIQLCFVMLQLTATVIVFFGSASIYYGYLTVEWFMGTLIPGLLCEVVLLYLAMRAGVVSDLCGRVPMLVNSANAKLEIKRMYLVDYIVHCKAGFYIFEMRLSSAALLKLSYVAFVWWCGLLTQGRLA